MVIVMSKADADLSRQARYDYRQGGYYSVHDCTIAGFVHSCGKTVRAKAVMDVFNGVLEKG